MSFRTLTLARKFTTSSVLWKPRLSKEYRSDKLWSKRFECKFLADDDVLQSINTKILTGVDLDALDTDIFINVAMPKTDQIEQLQESIQALSKLRMSIYAQTILPSTYLAICRLFLDSGRLLSLLNILEDRVKYGVFPDFFTINLLLDEAIKRDDFATAARLANLVMLQEEFGLHHITDRLCLYGLAKYIESKTDFESHVALRPENDAVLTASASSLTEGQSETKTEDSAESKKSDEDDGDDEEEEDAEYIRVPFLRNPYNDGHFDLDNPRLFCAKSLLTLAQVFKSNEQIATRARILGLVLNGDWDKAIKSIDEAGARGEKLGPLVEVLQFYVEDLHGVDRPIGDDVKSKISSSLDKVSGGDKLLSDLVDEDCNNFRQSEMDDLKQLEDKLLEWSQLRQATADAKQEREDMIKLRDEVKRKKEDLRMREQYLYFYDNLKKTKLTRIEYK